MATHHRHSELVQVNLSGGRISIPQEDSHTHTRTHTRTHALTHTHTHTRMHARAHTHTQLYGNIIGVAL